MQLSPVILKICWTHSLFSKNIIAVNRHLKRSNKIFFRLRLTKFEILNVRGVKRFKNCHHKLTHDIIVLILTVRLQREKLKIFFKCVSMRLVNNVVTAMKSQQSRAHTPSAVSQNLICLYLIWHVSIKSSHRRVFTKKMPASSWRRFFFFFEIVTCRTDYKQYWQQSTSRIFYVFYIF